MQGSSPERIKTKGYYHCSEFEKHLSPFINSLYNNSLLSQTDWLIHRRFLQDMCQLSQSNTYSVPFANIISAGEVGEWINIPFMAWFITFLPRIPPISSPIVVKSPLHSPCIHLLPLLFLTLRHASCVTQMGTQNSWRGTGSWQTNSGSWR